MDDRRVDYILEVIWNMFWIPTAGLHVERDHCARLRLYWYNGQYDI